MEKKKSYLSPVPSQTILAAPSIFIPMTSNHLSHQSRLFHPWTLKFFTEGETHCNLITVSPGELSTWACGREMKGEDCSTVCDCGVWLPRGKYKLGKQSHSHHSTSEVWVRERQGRQGWPCLSIMIKLNPFHATVWYHGRREWINIWEPSVGLVVSVGGCRSRFYFVLLV